MTGNSRRQAVRLLVLAAMLGGGDLSAQPADDSVAANGRAFVQRHCVRCHGQEEAAGELSLDELGWTDDFPADLQRWERIVRRVELGEMPPPDQSRPTAQERQQFVRWASEQAASRRMATTATVAPWRRLNRHEYEQTLQDLLGIVIDVKDQLPEEGAVGGFDNAAESLHVSSFLMERYLDAAERALDLAIANRPRPPLLQQRYHVTETHVFRTATERVYRRLDQSVVCFCSSEWHNVGLTPFYPPHGGFYRFRISASAYQSQGKSVAFRVVAGNSALTGKSGLVDYFEAPPDAPTEFEFVRYMQPYTTISLLPYGLPPAQVVDKTDPDSYAGPGLAIHWIEVEGPLHATWPPASHDRIFGNLPQQPQPRFNRPDWVEVVSDRPLDDAQQILLRFGRRAFRRKVVEADIAPYRRIVENRLSEGYTFEQAVRAALKGMLISPEFLFVRTTPGQLDDYAIASRLTYFLWNSMPDDDLWHRIDQPRDRETGSNTSLFSNRPALHAEVERLLNDPKSAAFTENFVGQWLGLRAIDFTEPSHVLYPEFDHLLKVSMLRETELFFDEMLREDLSILNFVNAEFSMLNGRLARHYGLADYDGPLWTFHRTTLPGGSHRGGVLTMASVLKVTANGTTTSPVLRGAWVLDRILGLPPTPPPPNIGAIEPDVRGATTIREQLDRHRSSPACASCHAQIDPPGFALENFDCIGGWRDHFRVTGQGEPVVVDGRQLAYLRGKPVDARGVLVDGTEYRNVDEFKQLLLRDQEQIVRAFVIRMLTYARGVAPTLADRPQVDAIVARLRERGYGLRTLVHEVAECAWQLEALDGRVEEKCH